MGIVVMGIVMKFFLFRRYKTAGRNKQQTTIAALVVVAALDILRLAGQAPERFAVVK